VGRVIIVVIDACGVGALPDADLYGDEGANTLAHVAEAVGGLRLPTLQRLGLGTILPLQGLPAVRCPAVHGRLHALGPGKDSTAGHWELMGVVVKQAPPTYPDGFPDGLIARLEAAMGHEVICNRPYNGIAAIEDFGAEHVRSGRLILYTSQDSVLQLAAHVDRLPVEELYRCCEAARQVMDGDDAVGRVIARPFDGAAGAFRRTDARRDYALAPPRRSYLDECTDAGVAVHGVGKIGDLFAGVGVTESHKAPTNRQALRTTEALIDELAEGLVFTNLIETDQVYGHRRDAQGFHRALQEIDAAVGRWLPRLRERDLLVITADHGVDPSMPGSDHTREYAPLLAIAGDPQSSGARNDAAATSGPGRHDGPLADVGATALHWLTGRETDELPGRPFIT
jgi:phosphopentomutase